MGRTLGDKDSQVFSNFIKEKIGIPNDRGFVILCAPDGINVG